jgi:integrase
MARGAKLSYNPSMPRPRPPHVHRQVSRHGKPVWYVRIGHGQRVRLPCGPGEPGFLEAYQLALAGDRPEPAIRRGPAVGTLRWLVDRYKETQEWASLAPVTRKVRERVFLQSIERAGDVQVNRITRTVIERSRDARAATPAQALTYLTTMRGLFGWAFSAGHIAENPTIGVRAIRRKKTAGFPAWTQEDVAKFEARWPVGTRERLAFDVLRYTGFRRSDAVRLGRPHVKDGVIRITTQKTNTRVTLALHPALAATIDASPCGDLTFIATTDGRPMAAQTLSNWFWTLCRELGIEKSAHGLRKWAASRMAEAGASDKEMQAAFGWTNSQMSSLYTKEADRERLGIAASRRVIKNSR